MSLLCEKLIKDKKKYTTPVRRCALPGARYRVNQQAFAVLCDAHRKRAEAQGYVLQIAEEQAEA